jgi:hypothetical protein
MCDSSCSQHGSTFKYMNRNRSGPSYALGLGWFRSAHAWCTCLVAATATQSREQATWDRFLTQLEVQISSYACIAEIGPPTPPKKMSYWRCNKICFYFHGTAGESGKKIKKGCDLDGCVAVVATSPNQRSPFASHSHSHSRSKLKTHTDTQTHTPPTSTSPACAHCDEAPEESPDEGSRPIAPASLLPSDGRFADEGAAGGSPSLRNASTTLSGIPVTVFVFLFGR